MKSSIIKKLVPMIFIAHTSLVSAATPGAYVGAGIGYSHLNNFADATQESEGGLGGRAFFGYNFNKYLGIEGHYALLHKTTYELDDYYGISADYNLNALGLAGQFYLPVTDTFNLYCSVGGAQMQGEIDAKYREMLLTSESTKAIVLAVGFGANADLTEHVTAGINFTAYQGKEGDDDRSAIPQSQLGTLSLAYKF